MTSRTCEQYDQQENEKADSQEDEVRRRKKIFQCEVGEEDAPEENGISNRLCSSTFIPPLTPNHLGRNSLREICLLTGFCSTFICIVGKRTDGEPSFIRNQELIWHDEQF